MKINNRPQNLSEFYGQKRIKSIINLMIESSKERKEILDHILLIGQSGFGKTTLAQIIANENNSKIIFTQGSLLEKKSDILSLVMNIEENGVIFIDEIHSANKEVIELLYQAMEDFVFDLPTGIEGDQKVIRVQLPKFTLIGASTKSSQISLPFKNRFGYIGFFENYSKKDIIYLINNELKKINLQMEDIAKEKIAICSQNNPRKSKLLLMRIFDYAVVNKVNKIDLKSVEKILNLLGIFPDGLNAMQVNCLKILAYKFQNKSVNLNSLINFLEINEKEFLKDVEPILIKSNLIITNTSGRKISNLGIEYLSKIN